MQLVREVRVNRGSWVTTAHAVGERLDEATCEVDGRRLSVIGAMDLKRPSRLLGAANECADLLI